MSSIIIREEDRTTGTGFITSRDIVYIPGFMKQKSVGGTLVANTVDKPVLYTSLSKFKEDIGSTVPTFATTKTITYGSISVSYAADAKDPSYIMAAQLLQEGIPVLYEVVNDTDAHINAEYMYGRLYTAPESPSTEPTSILTKLIDKATYRIKYLTTGGYPAFEYALDTTTATAHKHPLVDLMLSVAGSQVSEETPSGSTSRADCIALIDHCNSADRVLTGSGSVFAELNTSSLTSGEFGAMFTPWCEYPITNISGTTAFDLPASFAYLKAVAKIVRYGRDPWLPIANISRGRVALNKVQTTRTLSSQIANSYQQDTGRSINAITYIYPDGYCIWGDRTLKDNTTDGLKALSYLHNRNVFCDIHKVAYDAAKSFMFEPNTQILWLNFRAELEALLDRMKASSALTQYVISKDTERSTKTALYAYISVQPMYCTETFDIAITADDSAVSVEEMN